MNLGQIEKEEMGAYASLQPLLKFADNYAKDSKFVITGDDDVDSAALRQMGSGLKISGILTATGLGIAAGRVASKPLTKAAAKQLAKLKVKEGLKLSAESVARAAKELGLSVDDTVRAFRTTMGEEINTKAFAGIPDPSDLLNKAKKFQKNLKGARTNRKNAELEADIKNAQEIVDELEPKVKPKQKRDVNQRNTDTYNEADSWNQALSQKLEADDDYRIASKLLVNTSKGKKELERLAKKHGTKADINDLKAELKRKRTAANKAEKKRRETFEEDHNIDLDEWGTEAGGGDKARYKKDPITGKHKRNPKTKEKIKVEGTVTLREFLEGKGKTTRKSFEGSTEEATEKATKL